MLDIVQLFSVFNGIFLDPDPYNLIRFRIRDPAIIYTDPDPAN